MPALKARWPILLLIVLVSLGACNPLAQQGPHLGEVLTDEHGRAHSLVFGGGNTGGIEWMALASRDDMTFVDFLYIDEGWVCTFSSVPSTPMEEIAHVCLPPLAEGELIGRTTLRATDGVQFMHGIADDTVQSVRLQTTGWSATVLAVPLAALGLPDRVFAFAFPRGTVTDYVLVALDASDAELGQVHVTPPPPLPTVPPPQ